MNDRSRDLNSQLDWMAQQQAVGQRLARFVPETTEDDVRKFGLKFADQHTKEAKRWWDEAEQIKTDVEVRSKKLKRRIQTTPAGDLNQRELRKERDRLVRESQRAEAMEAEARKCEEDAARIKEDPVRYIGRLRDKYGLR